LVAPLRWSSQVTAAATALQTPNMDKCQELLHLQLTAAELPSGLGSEERREKLRHAMAGRPLCLFLDDCWDGEHERALNFVDDAAGAKVVISSRVRAVLEGATVVQVGVPSEDDAVQVLSAAGYRALPLGAMGRVLLMLPPLHADAARGRRGGAGRWRRATGRGGRGAVLQPAGERRPPTACHHVVHHG
jgi:hypothetical protein